MKLLTWKTSLLILFISTLFSLLYLPKINSSNRGFTFHVTAKSSAEGHLQLFLDNGKGFSESNSVKVEIPETNSYAEYVFNIPEDTYYSLRLDPNEKECVVCVKDAKILNGHRKLVKEFKPADFISNLQVESLTDKDGTLIIKTARDSDDPELIIKLSQPLKLTNSKTDIIFNWFYSSYKQASLALKLFVSLILIAWIIDNIRLRSKYAGNLKYWIIKKQKTSIVLISLIATILGALPVVFSGSSYVSPNITTLLYDHIDTLPGIVDHITFNGMGTDVGAIAWQHIPYSAIQAKALSGGELPLWNRYNSAGSPLLGQLQSMLGDPIHLFVILSKGASLAWDLKFLISKWLFCASLGLLTLAYLEEEVESVKRLISSKLISALTVSVASSFIGFFIYRVNHPAYFSVCYSPWILYSWMLLIKSKSVKKDWYAILFLILTNWTVMNSGTVKEAYILLLVLNLSGFVQLLASTVELKHKAIKILGVVWAGCLFLMFSSPIWYTFLDTIKQSYTSYNIPRAYQIQPSLALGFFDELFYRPFMLEESVFNPSVNFLIFFGFLYFVATIKDYFTKRNIITLSILSLLPIVFVFGIIPPSLIRAVPFLGQVYHIDNTFSCVLLTFVTVLSGVGFNKLIVKLINDTVRNDLIIVTLLFTFILFIWLGAQHAEQRSVINFVLQDNPIRLSNFVLTYLVLLILSLVLLVSTAKQVFVKNTITPVRGIFITISLFVIFWRFAIQPVGTVYPKYTVQLPKRADFHAKSEAVDYILKNQHEPSRTIGLVGSLFPGWNAYYGLEHIDGPDGLMLASYRQLLMEGPLKNIWGWRVYVDSEDIVKVKPYLDSLNVKYFLGDPSLYNKFSSRLHLLNRLDLDVFESTTVWPRAFFSNKITTYKSNNDYINKVMNGDGRPFIAIDEIDLKDKQLTSSALDSRIIQPAYNYKLTNNTTSFDVKATSSGYVLLSEAWMNRDFRVKLNNIRVPYLRLNQAFKGIVIPKEGIYHVQFEYYPHHLGWAFNFAAIGIVLLGLTTFLVIKIIPKHLV